MQILILTVWIPCLCILGLLLGARLESLGFHYNQTDLFSKSSGLKAVRFVFLCALLGYGGLLLANPNWLLHLYAVHYSKEILFLLIGGMIYFIGGVLFGLCRKLDKVKLQVPILIIIWYSFTIWFHFNHNYPDASEISHIVDDGIVLQSTPYSCVPASCANICLADGVKLTEKDLAVLMRTGVDGTTVPSAMLAMTQLGYECENMTISAKKLAKEQRRGILEIDHAATGPESHVVMYAGIESGKYKIIDPLKGITLYSEEGLTSIWHGRFTAMFLHK